MNGSKQKSRSFQKNILTIVKYNHIAGAKTITSKRTVMTKASSTEGTDQIARLIHLQSAQLKSA